MDIRILKKASKLLRYIVTEFKKMDQLGDRRYGIHYSFWVICLMRRQSLGRQRINITIHCLFRCVLISKRGFSGRPYIRPSVFLSECPLPLKKNRRNLLKPPKIFCAMGDASYCPPGLVKVYVDC